jgi:hypothetical protein
VIFHRLHGEGVIETSGIDLNVGLVGGEELKRLPSTTIVVAGNDPLKNDGLLFARNLQRNGRDKTFFLSHIAPY